MKNKTYFINGRFLTQQPTGVQFFAQEICNELMANQPVVFLVPKTELNINYQLEKLTLKKIGVFKGHLWEQVSLPWFLFWQKNWFLFNFCNTAPLFIKNQLVTVHDLAFMRNEKWFNPIFKRAYQFIIPKILNNSKIIVTVSETVKNEISTKFKISSEKIEVLTNKISTALLNAKPSLPQPNIKEKTYYLMVGSANPRKNFAWVEQQFKQHLHSKTLVIVGGNHHSFSSTQKVQSKNIIRISSASANQLAWLYKNAIAFINPSFYEGFGIPNIEAMFFNCPILCSDIPVFKEVCGGIAYFFKLNNSEDFIDKIAQVEKKYISDFQQLAKIKVAYYQQKNRAAILLKRINDVM